MFSYTPNLSLVKGKRLKKTKLLIKIRDCIVTNELCYLLITNELHELFHILHT